MFFEKLDCFLIDCLEYQSHQFQRLTGKDCFWLAEFFLYAFAATWICFGEYQILIGHAKIPLVIIGGLFIFVVTISNLVALEAIKIKLKKNPQFKNQNKLDRFWRNIRFFWLFLSVYNLIPLIVFNDCDAYDYALSISSLSLCLFFYFYACTPLPPCTSMIKKLLNKVSEVLTLNTQPATSSSPS